MIKQKASDKTAFVICPVRDGVPRTAIDYVSSLEHDGWMVHFPPRDTPQTGDPTGYNICGRNKREILEADKVFILWDGKSQGCLFDAGMAFAFNKNIEVIGLPDLTDGKSFQNMIAEWEKQPNR